VQQAVNQVKQQFVLKGKVAAAGLKARDGKTNGDFAGDHAAAGIVGQFKAQHVRESAAAQKTPMQVAHGGGIQHRHRQIAQGGAENGVDGAKLGSQECGVGARAMGMNLKVQSS